MSRRAVPLQRSAEILARGQASPADAAAAHPAAPDPAADAAGGASRSGAEDAALVAAALGRRPAGAFRVVVRRPDGTPAVIENAPFLADGTPMPTRYWLVDPVLRSRVSQLEASGGVRRAAASLDPAAVALAHDRYARARDALITPAHAGPRPSGGVGGTRTGVKCLHAHLAWWLAGGDDPVGGWVAVELGLHPPDRGQGCDPSHTECASIGRPGARASDEGTEGGRYEG